MRQWKDQNSIKNKQGRTKNPLKGHYFKIRRVEPTRQSQGKVVDCCVTKYKFISKPTNMYEENKATKILTWHKLTIIESL